MGDMNPAGPEPYRDAAGRRGVVLVVTLIALVALEAIALGVMRMAMQEAAVAAAHERALRARLAAEHAVVDVAALWRPAPGAHAPQVTGTGSGRVAALSRTTEDGFTATATLERTVDGRLLATARVLDAAGTRYAAGLLSTPFDPLLLEPFFPGALHDAASQAVAELSAERLVAAAGGAPDRLEAGSFRVAPVAGLDGECDATAHGNWGEPAASQHPCSRYYPIIRVATSARVLGGGGQGVLVVTGRLVLAADARWYGPVIVTGELLLEQGARIDGAVTLVGGTAAGTEARVFHDPSAVRRALAGSGLTRRLPPAGPHRWLPLF
jgi:hypothetical protein